jgi:hypothetical protein
MAGLDGYDVRARLTPGYLVLTPLLAAAIILTAEHPSILTALAALLVGLGVPFVLTSLVHDRGKAIEPELWSRWGGAPTTAMLRATNPDPDVTARRRRVQERAGAPLPAALAQGTDGEAADREIQAVVNMLIKQTRSDAVVQSELGDYGMRRNLLSVRDLGLLCSAATFGVGVGDLLWTLLRSTATPLPPIGIIVIATLSGVAWLRVSPDWVKVAADRYAVALLT